MSSIVPKAWCHPMLGQLGKTVNEIKISCVRVSSYTDGSLVHAGEIDWACDSLEALDEVASITRQE